MSDRLYDGSYAGDYDDYDDYMMASGLGGVGDVDDVDEGREGVGGGNNNNDKVLFQPVPGATRVPPTPRKLERFSKKARLEDGGDVGGGTGKEGDEKGVAVVMANHGPPEGHDPDPRGRDDAVGDSGVTGAGSKTLGENGVGDDEDDDDDDVEEEDPQAAAYFEHMQQEMGRVCSSLQGCLQGLAMEYMNYYRANMHVKKVYAQVLEKEMAESRRLDALEPQVRLLKSLVQNTSGMGGGGAGGGGGFLSATMEAPSPIPMVAGAAAAATATSEARSRSAAPVTPATHLMMMMPPARGSVPQTPRHPSHAK